MRSDGGLLSLVTVLSLICAAVDGGAMPLKNQTEREALLAFKSLIVIDPRGATTSWTETSDVCDWEGITCGGDGSAVVELDLKSRGLVGNLPPHIGNLTSLRVIDLQNNTLRGEIPPEIGRLSRLNVLSLKNNSFSGDIPSNLSSCSQLEVLDVGRNKLTGKIPPELASLTKLRVLSMHWNDLTGGIPDFIQNLTSLEVISLARCPLGGSIPDWFRLLRKLTFVGLGGAGLTGPVSIPTIFNNLSSISVIAISENNLTGTLAGIQFHHHLTWFQINGNSFTGTVPASFSNASELEFIDMSYNFFSGPLPVRFGKMKNLSKLFLHSNSLEGDLGFLESLINSTNLVKLDLAKNNFRGFLPPSISNLSKQLKLLDVSSNEITGFLPSSTSGLVGLNVLDLSRNQLAGPIPADIGRLYNLYTMDFSMNEISGEIPESVGNLTDLNELILHDNELQGSIPPRVGRCRRLLLIDLSNNRIHGSIPREILQISSLSIALNLSNNALAGSIPSEIGGLNSLAELGISNNRLSGDIPPSIGQCSSLQVLSMERNRLRGYIPSSFSSLRAIEQLDLSQNNLSGKIPEFLGFLPLKMLNLSSNNFHGEVPDVGVFSKPTSSLSVSGNAGLCGGALELRLPRCIPKKSQSMVVTLLLFAVLGTFIPSLIFFCLCKKRKQEARIPEITSSSLSVSYATLHRATDCFSPVNLVGAGSFGSVYRGVLLLRGCSVPVAIKVFDLRHCESSKSFKAECRAMREIRHRNLLRMVTACCSLDSKGNEFRALIYEFMPEGSLESWLHSSSSPSSSSSSSSRKLSFIQRLNIAVDVASALEYLHRQCKIPIVHCDLKPSNVLLDSDMTARVGDFGLARFVSPLQNTDTIGINGSVGYAAPEYGLGNRASPSGDVYSFGILLLEMMTGKRPTDPMFDGGLSLHGFVKAALPDRLEGILDPFLLRSGIKDVVDRAKEDDDGESRWRGWKMEEMRSLLQIGVACTVQIPRDRMDINDVVRLLSSLNKIK